jgi:integrase
MSSVRKVGSGRSATFVARWRTPTGASRQATFTREKDARDHLAEVDAGKRSGHYVDPADERMRYGTWAASWSAGRINWRGTTRARNESVLRTHVLPHFGDVPVGAISQPDVVKWIRTLHDSGLSPATTLVAYQIFSASMKGAVVARQLRFSPCIGVELPKIERAEQRFLDHADVSRLAACMPDRYEALVLLLSYAGLRIGEAAALRRDKVNLLRGTVTVAATATEVRGEWIEQRPKTDAGRRTVPMQAGLVDALREHMETYSQPGHDGLVFTAPEGGPLRVNAFRRRVWAPAVTAAGLDPLNIHALRHTAVSLWVSADADESQLQQWAGHTSSTFTRDRYGHLYDRDATAVLGRLDAEMTRNKHTDADVVPFRVANVLDG